MYRFRVKVEERAGGYVVTVPAVPGCVASGRTREDALRKARDVLQAILIQVGPFFPLTGGGGSTPGDLEEGEFLDVSAPSLPPC